MFDTDLLVAFFLMSALFLRQIAILKQANKINYAPLMVSIGAISSVVHFILHPDTRDVILLLRESFVPFLLALILYTVMNVLHQTQRSLEAKVHDALSYTLMTEISQLKTFMLELESRMQETQKTSTKTQEDIHQRFFNDVKVLEKILENQNRFASKFDEMAGMYKEITHSFEFFSEVKLPELDSVVHKHIDILRVAEQDHYNKLRNLLEKAVQSRYDMAEDLEELKTELSSIKSVSDEIANTITAKTVEKLRSVTQLLESEILLLKAHTESLKTSLSEEESMLHNIKMQSEMLMQQMTLSSKKMDTLEKQNYKLHDVYGELNELIHEVEAIKADYQKAQTRIGELFDSLENSKNEQMMKMEKDIASLHDALAKKIDESLEQLHEHYHIASEDISQSVKILAKKAQSQKGYSSLEE